MSLTEGDLIEVENVVMKHYEQDAKDCDGFTQTDRVVRTLTALVSLGRAALANTSTESTGSDNASKKTGQDANS